MFIEGYVTLCRGYKILNVAVILLPESWDLFLERPDN